MKKDLIKTLVPVTYLNYFEKYSKNKVSESDLVDGALDIEVFTINFIELLGYDNEKASEEVYKHISCRKQDPKQKLDWENNIGLTEKWKKWQEQPKEELYEPDYLGCKLK